MRTFNITVNGQTYVVDVEEVGGVQTAAPVRAAAPVAAAPVAAPAAAPKAAAAAPVAGGEPVKAPMPGNILDVKVKVGDTVKAGTVLCVLEAMKMENEIPAPKDGKVAQVVVTKGATVGATATASTFLTVRTLEIIAMGIVAFGMGTAGGVLLAKLMNKLSGGKINPLIGSAGVSAVPMAARVSQKEGQKANPANFLLMHAMGPNVAGVIGSAIAAGVLLSMFG